MPDETILIPGAGLQRLLWNRVVEADTRDQPCLPQSAIDAPLRVFRQAGRDSSGTQHGSIQIERPP
jgi:hypothetical protein